MDNDIERLRRMASMAQIGWWEADFTAGHYLCSEYLCDLLGLEGNTISFMDFRERVRKDYQEQIVREFNASIHREFYEQTFPIYSKEGIIWLHTRLGNREEVPGRIISFGTIQRVEAPNETSERILERVNDLLYRQNSISHSLLRFLKDDSVDLCIMDILKDILDLFVADGCISLSMMNITVIRTVPMKWWQRECRRRLKACNASLPTVCPGGRVRPYRVSR